MKKFILHLIAFFISVIISDFCLGIILIHIRTNAKGGNTFKMEYVLNQMEDSVIFIGSSRCLHNYDPSIFSKELNLSSYNCGIEGTGIIMFYPMIKNILKRYHPKFIIYDVYDNFDILSVDDNSKYLSQLKPYYFELNNAFDIVDTSEKIKMLSSSYRYNSKLFTMIGDFVRTSKNKDNNGYKPLYGTMKYEPHKSYNSYDVDKIKLRYIELLVLECKKHNVQLIFCISPSYKFYAESNYKAIYEIAKLNNVPILDHITDTVYKKKYFYDSVHLNVNGTMKYSHEIANRIKKFLEDKNK